MKTPKIGSKEWHAHMADEAAKISPERMATLKSLVDEAMANVIAKVGYDPRGKQ